MPIVECPEDLELGVILAWSGHYSIFQEGFLRGSSITSLISKII